MLIYGKDNKIYMKYKKIRLIAVFMVGILFSVFWPIWLGGYFDKPQVISGVDLIFVYQILLPLCVWVLIVGGILYTRSKYYNP